MNNRGDALQFVPPELKTAELCRAAVEDDGWALAFVPKGLRTAELCIAAVKQADEYALEYVPAALRAEVAAACPL